MYQLHKLVGKPVSDVHGSIDDLLINDLPLDGQGKLEYLLSPLDHSQQEILQQG